MAIFIYSKFKIMNKELNLTEERSIVTSTFTNKGSENAIDLSDEVWKDISGYEGKYQISSHGRVKSLFYHNTKGVKREGFLKVATDKKGYSRCALSLNNKLTTFKVHRLVASAFIPNPSNLPMVNHIDGNKSNNNVSNLEWCDNSYNQKHAWKNGSREPFNNRKLCNFNSFILKSLIEGKPKVWIARKCNVALSSLYRFMHKHGYSKFIDKNNFFK